MTTYVVGGRLGDLLHVMWVVKRRWETDGRKAVIVMSDRYGGDTFSRGLRGTWDDVRGLLEGQEYVERLELDEGSWEPPEPDGAVNLNVWRSNGMLVDWTTILANVYGLERVDPAGGWIAPPASPAAPADVLGAPLKDLVVVHQSKVRLNPSFPWDSVLANNECVFVTCDASEYDSFPHRDRVRCHVAKGISEMAAIVGGAKAFCGNQSAPLALAVAMGKTCYCQPSPNDFDVLYYKGIGSHVYLFGFSEPPTGAIRLPGRPAGERARTRVLFLNHATINCGVYQYGKRIADVLIGRVRRCEVAYAEVGVLEDYKRTVAEWAESNTDGHHVILYNYHAATMPWLCAGTLASGSKHVGIPHESPCDFFDSLIDIGNAFMRPLIELGGAAKLGRRASVREFVEYGEGQDIPVIGSFGFGFDNKGFHRIVEKVCREYDRAVIKLAIPVAFFDPDRENTVIRARHRCLGACVKPGISLIMFHEFLTEVELMAFLESNTLNLFLYDDMPGRGISSALDYAMSSGRPLGVSNSCMFRHVHCGDIDAASKTCEELIKSGGKWVGNIDCRANNDELAAMIEDIIMKS